MTRQDFQRATGTTLNKTGDVDYDILSGDTVIGKLTYGSIGRLKYREDYAYICSFTHNGITVSTHAYTEDLCLDKASTRYNSELYTRACKEKA